jgi:hypothetical protein
MRHPDQHRANLRLHARPKSPPRRRRSPTDTAAVTAATKSAENPNGQDVVYWIAPPAGEDKVRSSELVFHLCANVSPFKDKVVNSGSVTEAYAQNAVRITKQIAMEQGQCGFTGAGDPGGNYDSQLI